MKKIRKGEIQLMVDNTPIIIISIIFVAFAIFAFIDAQCVELSVASIIVAIVFFTLGYEIPYDIKNYQVPLEEKISTSYVNVITDEDGTERKIKYINESGKIVTLDVSKDTDIYYKNGKGNKIVYKETKYHNLLGFFDESVISKVIIYKN